MQPRDLRIDWDAAARRRSLQRLVKQSRFLIWPWVCVPHLVSHMLALSVRRLATDWVRTARHRHGSPPKRIYVYPLVKNVIPKLLGNE